ncbi:MAG TPA: VWA domain-containing protein, partial [Pontiella sp.]
MLIHFYNPAALIWLWLVPAVAGLFAYAAVKRRQALQIFGTGGSAIPSRKREAFGSCAAILLIVLALARPAWNLQEHALQESGRDVIFLLDVSRSMLAEDLHPNRLENAKIAILDCVEELSTDRIGLVLFAGSAEIRCPLTVDYDYFRMALRQASPESVGSGGTMIAHAIERTVDKLLDPSRGGTQDLILITDGEDLVEGPDEIAAAGKLSDAGVRLIAIGLGSKIQGNRIPLEGDKPGTVSFLKHGDTEVRTRLHSETLRRMAASVTGGIYFDVATGPFNLAQIYRQVMEHAERTTTDSRRVERYQEKFHLFLGAAVLALLLSHRWKRNRMSVVIVSLLLIGVTAQAGPVKLFTAGNNAYAEGRFEEAVTLYMEATAAAPDAAAIHYNLGNALYRSGDFTAAAVSFEQAASLAGTDELRNRCWYNLGNCLVKTGEMLRSDDPAAAVAYCRQAGWLYRRALDVADAAYNLEIAQQLAAEIEMEVERRKEQEQQQNELVQYLREKLEQFIRRQSALIEDRITGEPQEKLRQDTLALADVIEKSGL